MTTELPTWRSLMYVPVNVEKFVASAADRNADAYILDLEDAVAPARKVEARTRIAAAIPCVARNGADVLVRVNRPWRMLVADLEAAVLPGIAALALPKVESAEHIHAIAEMVDELEIERGIVPGTIKFIAMVETASAFFRIEAIARAHRRVVATTIGAEDIALSLGMLPEAEGLFYPKQQSVFAARAAGVLPLGFIGTVADYKDIAAFRVTIERSKKLGFAGAMCIHPSQVPILNEVYGVSADEVARAKKMVTAYDAALAAGVGAIEFKGKMIDIPVVARARDVLRRAEMSKRGKSAAR